MSDKYKDKYTRLLDELDEQEKEHGKKLQLLHSQIIRICGHVKGEDKELDEAVALLPQYIDPDNLPTDKLRLISELLGDKADDDSGSNDHVRTNLLYLFENLPTEIDSHFDRGTLLRSLEQITEPDQYLALIDQLENHLETTFTTQNKQIGDLSTFLEEIATRLDGFKVHLTEEEKNQSAQSENQSLLTDRVSQHVFDLRESVSDSLDLDSLKSAVQFRLDEIDNSVESFVKSETERAEKAEQANTELRERTRKLEAAAKQLQDSLAQSQQQAIEDPLTGIPNRRGYEERLAQEYARWKRHPEPLTLAILDIDKFKFINDNFGHPVGDKVLKTVTSVISSLTRESDFFGRIGGEEFALLMIDSTLEQAKKCLEDLRAGVENYRFGYKGKPVPVTISIGYATFAGADSPDEVYRRADDALLKCKETGRNKCLPEQ
ncbi:MAG: diguanylate cyclase [Pseudomonadales bacterium]|nr:diguanylate cyclase [Pseudomonadales bacterium]